MARMRDEVWSSCHLWPAARSLLVQPVCLPVESFREPWMKRAGKYAKRIGKQRARSSEIDPSGYRSSDRAQIQRYSLVSRSPTMHYFLRPIGEIPVKCRG